MHTLQSGTSAVGIKIKLPEYYMGNFANVYLHNLSVWNLKVFCMNPN